MRSTPKIYVDYMGAAAKLAAKYRNASYYVDVINRRDEMAYRWESGNPKWGGEIEGITAQVETYQFERPEDPFWCVENRMVLLAEALQYAQDITRGEEGLQTFDALLIHEEVTNDEVWDLIWEAEEIAQSLSELKTWERTQRIEKWMLSSRKAFVGYRTEFTALTISIPPFQI